MTPNPLATLILAQRSSWDALGTRFSGDHLQWQTEDAIGLALLFVGFGGGLWLLQRLAKWQESKPRLRSPKRLFGELAAAHGLTRGQRRVCREVAAEAGLGDPAALFVRTEARAVLTSRDAKLADRLYGAVDAARD